MSRTDEFAGGSSLEQNSARQNSEVPHDMVQTSVLQPYIQSANGMSAADAPRRLVGGGMLASPNGASASTYEAERPMTNKFSATSA